MNYKTFIGGVLALLLAAFGGAQASGVLGATTYDGLHKWYGNGLSAGGAVAGAAVFVVDAEGDLTTSGTSAFSGTVTFSATTTDAAGTSCIGTSGTFANATTSLFAFKSPFGATSTVTYTSVDVTTGTTSAAFKVGTSTTQYPTLASSVSAGLMNAALGTSSVNYLVTAGNNITDTGVAETSMEVGPTDWIAGHASSTNSMADHNGGILGGNNGFSGTYKMLICR